MDALGQCVRSLSEIERLLSDATDRLKVASETNTYLARTLMQPKKVCELVSEYDLLLAKMDQVKAVDPLVKTLESKVTVSLDAMQSECEYLEQTYAMNSQTLETTVLAFDDDENGPVAIGSSTNEEAETLRRQALEIQEWERKITALKAQMSENM